MARKKGKRCSKNLSGTSTGKASRKRERDMKFPKLTQRYVNVTQRVKHTQMKECLVKIFDSQFNRIFINSGFSIGVKLESLREKLTDKSTKHSVEDIAKEAGEDSSSLPVVTAAFLDEPPLLGSDCPTLLAAEAAGLFG